MTTDTPTPRTQAAYDALRSDEKRSDAVSECIKLARTLERELAAARAEIDSMRPFTGQQAEQIIGLSAEVEGMLADAENYRWLRDNDGGDKVIINWNIGHDWVSVENLDAAIDAAKERKQPPEASA